MRIREVEVDLHNALIDALKVLSEEERKVNRLGKHR